MRSIKFPESNHVFTKPEGWDEQKDGVCHDLHVLVTPCEFHPGQIYVVSAWLPEQKDIEAILAGRPIYLQIYGCQPPVSVYTLDENGNLNPDNFEK